MKNPERECVDSVSSPIETALAFVLSEVKTALKKAGIEEDGEAEWLVANCLGKKRFDLRFIEMLTESEVALVREAMFRRIKGEPLDKIAGEKEFYNLKFKVNKNVLSPRPETELLVENVLKYIENFEAKSTLKVLDLCTGSGAIAISVACGSDCQVLATDISESALEVAKHNAEVNGARVKFLQSDMFTNLGHKKFDIIVSNPPYIRTEEIPLLAREVKEFDPIISLDGGADGLYFYRIIAALAPSYLTKNGKLFLEIGALQGSKVKKLLTESFNNIKILKDYGGHDRIVIATKKD